MLKIPLHRVALALSVAFLVVAPTASTAYAESRPAQKLPAVYATDAHGRVLLPGANLRAGERVTMHASGFEPHVSVEVVDAYRRIVSHVRSDPRGEALAPFVAPRRRASARGVVVLAALAAGQPSSSSAVTRSRQRSAMSLVVTAPLLRQFDYRVGGGHGVAGQHDGHHSSGGLANTGFNLLALLLAGLIAVGIGIAADRSGRRHNSRFARFAVTP